MTIENDYRIKSIVDKAIYFLDMYLDNQNDIELNELRNGKEIINNNSDLSQDDLNLWKSYCWIEYSIFRLRLKKNNLYEINSSESPIKKNIKNMDIIKVVTILKERLKKIDYDDFNTMIIDLRESRDILKIILKRSVFKRGKTYKSYLSKSK